MRFQRGTSTDRHYGSRTTARRDQRDAGVTLIKGDRLYSSAVRELSAAIVEQVGEDQTDRLRRTLTEANNA